MTAALGLALVIAAVSILAVSMTIAWANASRAADRIASSLERATGGLTTERTAHADTRSRLEVIIALKNREIARLGGVIDANVDPVAAANNARRLLGGDAADPAPPAEGDGVRDSAGAGVEERGGGIRGGR